MDNTDFTREQKTEALNNIVLRDQKISSYIEHQFTLFLVKENKKCLYCFTELTEKINIIIHMEINFEYFCSKICSILYLSIYNKITHISYNNIYTAIPFTLIKNKDKFKKLLNKLNNKQILNVKCKYESFKIYFEINTHTKKFISTLEIYEFDNKNYTLTECLNCLEKNKGNKFLKTINNTYIGPFCDKICKMSYSSSLNSLIHLTKKYNIVLPDIGLFLNSNLTIPMIKQQIVNIDYKFSGHLDVIFTENPIKINFKLYKT